MVRAGFFGLSVGKSWEAMFREIGGWGMPPMDPQLGHFVGIWVWGQGPGAVSQIAVIAGMIYPNLSPLGSPAGVEHFDT